ncbi:Flp pilus assembly protein CpaB [Blastococcus xanthinilyticus]|uniref:Flp pilus assembly protein CpaB n=1 Tax=Blastococcus xanthinilyticus TaxID=1564164 RepID=A0A5S5CV27_9ACTN|nr:Flp pilus assembly protein CpaB [Blastococcus xanthinilyticus]TYP86189.1 Flp pilus assembly protein CpaB [Blastococcus xanthinilyticus]
MPRLRRPRFPLLAARRAVAAALAVMALVLAMRPGTAPAGRPPPGSPVVVAAVPLPAGTALGADHLRVVRLPAAAVPDGVAGTPDVLLRRVLAGPVRAGEPLTDARLVGPGLTDQLPAGQVAAPVRLADLAVAALVRTGDRVDVLAAGAEGSTAERVASAALVLAAPGADGGDAPGAGLLLLAVDPETAARLATAAATATLTVSLPPPPG